MKEGEGDGEVPQECRRGQQRSDGPSGVGGWVAAANENRRATAGGRRRRRMEHPTGGISSSMPSVSFLFEDEGDEPEEEDRELERRGRSGKGEGNSEEGSPSRRTEKEMELDKENVEVIRPFLIRPAVATTATAPVESRMAASNDQITADFADIQSRLTGISETLSDRLRRPSTRCEYKGEMFFLSLLFCRRSRCRLTLGPALLRPAEEEGGRGGWCGRRIWNSTRRCRGDDRVAGRILHRRGPRSVYRGQGQRGGRSAVICSFDAAESRMAASNDQINADFAEIQSATYWNYRDALRSTAAAINSS
ncbi:MAG: hypothetical protein M1823_000203 [Watsoniomyces obsoletus]|nr:MAG: hypothetical protein M1823_000203 [Watsoniomyces obsoletus]